jgi:putative glutamine amidotransferase
VERAGGIPVLLPPVKSLKRPLASYCQGLLLSGGGDPDPSLYGELPHPKLGKVDQERDHWELLLIRKAREEQIPILGICRGMQILNVALGGSLYQDLPSQYIQVGEHWQKLPGEEVSHQVQIKESTILHSLLEKGIIWTNSHHHQALKKLALGLIISAQSDDGVIEGIEATGEDFTLGVQWHPERLAIPESARIFTGFIRACRKKFGITEGWNSKTASKE